MKNYVIGVFNGFDVDDYYIEAASYEEAVLVGKNIAISVGGTLYSVVH